jgi:hypothetical protein
MHSVSMDSLPFLQHGSVETECPGIYLTAEAVAQEITCGAVQHTHVYIKEPEYESDRCFRQIYVAMSLKNSMRASSGNTLLYTTCLLCAVGGRPDLCHEDNWLPASRRPRRREKSSDCTDINKAFALAY